MSTPGGTGVIAGRRKLLVQDGHFTVCVPKIGHGFRRTLVGLKQLESVEGILDDTAFQTYPCGVEAQWLQNGMIPSFVVSDVPLWG